MRSFNRRVFRLCGSLFGLGLGGGYSIFDFLTCFLRLGHDLVHTLFRLGLGQIGACGNSAGKIGPVFLTHLTRAVDIRDNAGGLLCQLLGIGCQGVDLIGAQKLVRQVICRIILGLIRDCSTCRIGQPGGSTSRGRARSFDDRTSCFACTRCDVARSISCKAQRA